MNLNFSYFVQQKIDIIDIYQENLKVFGQGLSEISDAMPFKTITFLPSISSLFKCKNLVALVSEK